METLAFRLYDCMTLHDPHLQRRLKDTQGLLFVHRFGSLRTAELGKLLWPGMATARQSADRLARGWIERRLVLARQLPDGAGRALVLAAGGVDLLARESIGANSGKDIGKIMEAQWQPPTTWRHDLIAHGVLCELHRRGFQVYPETELRRRERRLAKIPDGLAVKDERVLWIEVENARKTGKAMVTLAKALKDVTNGQCDPVLGFKPSAALVAYVPSVLDERGYTLSHKARVVAALQREIRTDITLTWAACELNGTAGIGEITFSTERIASDRAAAILKTMNINGWQADEHGNLWVGYDRYRAFVWQEEDGGWGFEVESRTEKSIKSGYVSNISEAKREAANAIATL
jgi:hypothetical protein